MDNYPFIISDLKRLEWLKRTKELKLIREGEVVTCVTMDIINPLCPLFYISTKSQGPTFLPCLHGVPHQVLFLHVPPTTKFRCFAMTGLSHCSFDQTHFSASCLHAHSKFSQPLQRFMLVFRTLKYIWSMWMTFKVIKKKLYYFVFDDTN